MRRVHLAVLFGVAGVVLVALLWFAEPTAVIESLAGAELDLLVLALLGVVLALGAKSVATRHVFLKLGGDLSVGRSFLAYGAAVFAKLVLPMGRTGSVFLIAYSFNREMRVGYDRAVASVTVTETLNTLIGLVLTGVGVVWILPRTPAGPLAEDLGTAIGVTMAVVGLLLGLGWLVRFRLAAALLSVATVVHRGVSRVAPTLATGIEPERVERGLSGYLRTLGVVTADRRTVGVSGVFLLLSWLLFVTSLYLVGLALGVTLPFGLVLFLVPVGAIVSVSPLPGGLGTYELGVSAGLVVLGGISLTDAAAVTLLYRLCTYWFVLLLGGVSLTYTSATLDDFALQADVAVDAE